MNGAIRAILILMMGGSWALAAQISSGNVTLALDDSLNVTGLIVAGKTLPVAQAPLVTLWASDTGKTALPRVGQASRLPEGAASGTLAPLDLTLAFPEARATAQLQIAPRPGAAEAQPLHFRCTVKGEEGPDRGFILRFGFPVDATGWQWHDDMQSAVTITGGKLYENVVPLRAYADLPEWRDRPALRTGYSNLNFCTAITGPVGLVLAVPIDQPRMFRTAYDSVNKRLEMVYDFALSGLTRTPYEASFEFDLYACDPQWGLRSALQKYYAMYPELFKVYVPTQGQWMAFNRLSEIDNANEFGFGLQEGAPEPQYDDKIGVLDCTYYTHAGMWGNIPKPYDPEKDPLPPYEVQVKAVDESFRQQMGESGVYEKVGTRKPDGRLAVEKWSVYAHLIAQFNLDPELPWGKWLIERTTQHTASVKERTGGDLDGFYYDGLTSGLNYNRDHFATTDTPLLWDPVHKQAFLNNFFSSIEFARATAELLRPRGQITMMNGGLGESFYVVPWLDILGAETGLIVPRSGFNFVRASLHHKPFLTLLKGNYEQSIARPEMELFMKRCLAYGVYPGFFDWPPSGLGPGGQYWNHPRYYERDRDLFRKYQPLCKALALAGWEPVTYALSSNPKVYVERFGPSQGVVWLTLLNEQDLAAPTTLTVQTKALGLSLAGLRVTEIISGRTLIPHPPPPSERERGIISLDLTVPPGGVLAVQLGSPAAAARWHAGQALEAVDRGVVQRQVDADAGKGPQLVHWRPSGVCYDRETVGDKTNVVFHADGQNAMGMRQWVMLFQQSATPLKVKARVSGVKFGDTGGGARVQCRLAWVTPSYTHYDNQYLDIPTGTYDWRDVAFEIKPEHALRSLELVLSVTAQTTGDLKIASLSVTDAAGEHVIDPGFAEWYEPFPEALRQPLEAKVAALRQGLAGLQGKCTDIAMPQFRPLLTTLYKQCRELEDTVAKAKAENGCRRLLRDLETVEMHLSHVTLAAYHMPTPAITGPMTAAWGDLVPLKFAAPKVAGLPTRTEVRSDLKVIPHAGGATVVIPSDAQVGDSFTVTGLLHLGKPGAEATLRSTHEIRVLAPLEMSLKSEGFDATTGAARLSVRLRNNHLIPVTADVTLSAPPGWQTGKGQSVPLQAAKETTTPIVLQPAGPAVAGPLELTARATAGKDGVQARIVMLYIPPQANLLKNPSFEEGLSNWGIASDSLAVDTKVFRSGAQSLRMTNPTRRDTQASQTVVLNQKTPGAVLVQASAKAQEVSGQPDKGYSLYVDIYYTDGTPWYGTTFDFPTGTTDWQLGELYLEPAKPIRNVNVYLLLRGKTGTAWFDDVAVMEDPRRQGNLAREAKVTVDSSYANYDATPINDGIIIGEGLHWTKESWASAEEAQEHFIELTFPQAVTVARATIYWSLDAGIPRTSRQVLWQVFRDGAWQTVKGVTTTQPAPLTEIGLDQAVTGTRFRLLQPVGQGPAGRGNLMWVREVEVFGS